MASTAPSFIGSKISLISKSEIRYEGILYTIDTRESTIALAQVRSFGTENRVADKYVPPRDEVYEYIIFRANDIKDLIVDDPVTNVSALGDPAIIQAQGHISLGTGTSFSRANTTGTSTTGISSSIPVSTSSAAPSTNRAVGNNLSSVPVVNNASAGSQSSVTSGPPAAGPAFGATSVGFRSEGSTPTGTHRRSPISELGPQKNQSNIPRRDDNKPRNYMNNRDNRDNRNQLRDGRDGRDVYRGGGGGGSGGGRGFGDRRMGPMQYPPRRPMGPGPQPPRLMNPRLRGRPRPPMPMMNQVPPQRYRAPQMNRGPMNRNVKPSTSLKIDADYDFEKANREFEELESKLSKVDLDGDKNEAKEEITVATKEPEINEEKKDEDVFYDKTKSFFDKISCEAIERSKGKVNRIDWRQERKMNAETFGISANSRGGYRGRGNYHGGGYRRTNPNQRHYLY